MKLALEHGLGCALLYKGLFDYLLQNNLVDLIEYTIPPSDLRKEYPEEFQTTLLSTVDAIMDNPAIVQRQGVSYPGRTWRELMSMFDIPLRVPMRVPVLESATPPLPGRYVTLNMKVTDIKKSDLAVYLPIFVSILQRSKYPIVLTGERDLTPCSEYTIHANTMVSIYSFVREHLPSAIDRTYPETKVANTLDTLKSSAALYQHAAYNLLINSSGGLSLATIFGRLIALTTIQCPTIRVLELKNSIITHTPDAFLEHVAHALFK
jgi:hypothetical protein